MDLGYGEYFQFLFALIFVLALIAVLAAVARRYGLGYRTPSRGKKERRLSLVEVIPIDAKRRLALFRRDSVEHLVLLGAGSDLLVERGIPAPPEDFESALSDAVAARDETEGRS
ncbi:MAG: flagellar biosynthetic protein FliO [Rhodospirillales bacterium]|nr:flagellar biosynthetic protein FliO [Rhodospirillales bacterium]